MDKHVLRYNEPFDKNMMTDELMKLCEVLVMSTDVMELPNNGLSDESFDKNSVHPF